MASNCGTTVCYVDIYHGIELLFVKSHELERYHAI